MLISSEFKTARLWLRFQSQMHFSLIWNMLSYVDLVSDKLSVGRPNRVCVDDIAIIEMNSSPDNVFLWELAALLMILDTPN